MHFRLILSVLGILALAVLMGGSAASATTQERSQSDPTGWWWYYGMTPAQVTQLINDNEARIVDIEVEQSSPSYRFSVAMVKNEGAYAKAWWWYYGVTGEQLSANLSANSARLIDLEPYEVDGQVRFAAVMISNTGAQSKAWWWYYNASVSDITDAIVDNSGRLIDIESYFIGGVRRYSAVMIANEGADQKAWWWYVNVTPAQIGDLLQDNNARLIDLERHDTVAGTYAVIMESCPCPFWWWYFGLSETQVNDLVAQNGARIVDVETYGASSDRRFAVVMINNSNAITSRVGHLLRSGTDGVTGLYLKEVDGPVLAALQEHRIFEPSSSIKVLHHLHAMLQVQNGSASLGQSVDIYEDVPGTSCPGGPTGGSETLSDALREMMRRSDNERTKAVAVAFGTQNIINTAQSIGMTNTTINHHPGCGLPPNDLTLADAGLLYEGVASGVLLNPTNRETFYELMAGKEMFLDEGYDFTHIWAPLLDDIINQEAPPTLTQAQRQGFKALMRLNYKAGGDTICTGGSCVYHRSVAGWAEIPYCTNGLAVARQYVFGIFINDATDMDATNDTFDNTKAELLREQISAALSDWSPCTIAPTPTPSAVAGDADGSGSVNAIDAALILQLSAGLITTLPCAVCADVNGDGASNAIDAALVLQYDAGLIDHLQSQVPTSTHTYARPTPTPARAEPAP